MPPALNLEVLKATREAGPNVVINSRCVAELGDYTSTTDRPAEFAPHDGDWEGIPTTNESYGWHKSDLSHKPASHFITLIAKAAARGGNLMLNVGPRGDGTIDPADVAILQGIGKWMKINAESIHGTTATPLPVQAWGESTRKGDSLYLHVFDWPKDGKLIVGGLKSQIKGARLLADSSRTPLKAVRLGECDWSIEVPAQAPDATNSVVVLQFEGDIVTDHVRLLLTNQDNALRVFDGQLTGSTIKFGQGKRDNAHIEQWSKRDEYISWPVRTARTGAFKVSAAYDALPSAHGGKFVVQVGPNLLTGVVKDGEDLSQALGTVHLEAGNHEIRVQPIEIAGDELMRLRSITLTPVANETASR